jgi:hypothetical protein
VRRSFRENRFDFPLFLPVCPCPHFHLSGVQVNSAFITRNASRFDCFTAFITDEAIEMLARSINDRVASTRSVQQLHLQRRFAPVTTAEVWRWISQRLDISLNIKLTIEKAYNSVPRSIQKHISHIV